MPYLSALEVCSRQGAIQIHVYLYLYLYLHCNWLSWLILVAWMYFTTRAAISETFVAVANLPGRRALRSASTNRLVAPPIKLSTVGSRVFPVAAAQVWNGLPEAVVSSSSLQTFHRQLRTRLFNFHFQLSYPQDLIFWLFDWHRYSGSCSNVRYLGHSKTYVYLLTYSRRFRRTLYGSWRSRLSFEQRKTSKPSRTWWRDSRASGNTVDQCSYPCVALSAIWS